MFDERFRGSLPRVAAGGARRLVAWGVSPHAVTWFGLIAALLAAVLVGTGRPLAGLAVWIVSRIADGFDGLVARESGRTTPFGAYLDITFDMAGYVAMLIGFSVLHPAFASAWLAIACAYCLAITTTLALSHGATLLGRTITPTNRTFQFTAGLAEAGETSVMYALWVLFPQWLPWLAWIWVAVVIVTVVQRTRLAGRALR
jgi:phosphatidylglycerophosphate synthase